MTVDVRTYVCPSTRPLHSHFAIVLCRASSLGHRSSLHSAMSFTGRALQRAWHLVDAKDQTVGRLATVVAPILRGKHKPTYAPHQDVGDYVVIVNADKVQFTGNKWQGKCDIW